jgi:hypothetical protein
MFGVAKARGTVDDAAHLQPFTNVAAPNSPGYPMGYVYGAGRWHHDPLQLQRDGVIGGPAVAAFSDRGGAKTSYFKELGMFMSGSDVGCGRPARTGVAVVRRNAGTNEWQRYAEMFGVEPVDMMNARLNALSRGSGLPLSRRISWMNDTFEHQSEPLSLAEEFVASAALAQLYRVTPQDVDPYFRDYFGVISGFDLEAEIEFHRQSLETESFSDQLQGWIRSDHDQQELADARRQLRRRLTRLLGTAFGQTFGAERPVESILTSRQQVHDYSLLSAVSPETIPLIWSLILDIRNYADKTLNYDLMVEYEPFDETDTLLRYPITAKRVLHILKTIRGLSKVVGFSMHRLQDAYAIGEHDSEMRGIILDILEEFEIVLIGQLKGKRARDMIAEWKDLPPNVMNRIAGQGPGDFCVVIEGRDPLFIHRPLNPSLQVITESNRANRRKADRDRERAEMLAQTREEGDD